MAPAYMCCLPVLPNELEQGLLAVPARASGGFVVFVRPFVYDEAIAEYDRTSTQSKSSTAVSAHRKTSSGPCVQTDLLHPGVVVSVLVVGKMVCAQEPPFE